MSTAEIVSVVGLMIVFVTHAVIIARWSGKVQVLLDRQDEELRQLRKLVETHDRRLFEVEVRAEVNKRLHEMISLHGETAEPGGGR